MDVADEVNQIPKRISLRSRIARGGQNSVLLDDRVDDAIVSRTVSPVIADVRTASQREIDKVPARRRRIERALVVRPRRPVGDRVTHDRWTERLDRRIDW